MAPWNALRGLLWGLSVGGAIMLGLWWWQGSGVGWQWWGRLLLGLTIWGGAVGVAARYVRNQPCGHLQWRAPQWRWQPEGGRAGLALQGPLHVVWDSQQVLVVTGQLYVGGRMTWWLRQSQAPQQWAALRRAVYSVAHPPAQQVPCD